jgi:allophanate hydrolase subunit 2
MTRPVLEVLGGGLLTTVQDAGRPGWLHLGVPESGAADQWSLAIANLLVGNDPGTAALELTVLGPTLRALGAVTIGLAGADLGGRVRGGRRVPPGRSHRLAAGDVIDFAGGGTEAAAGSGGGIRAYLAVPGGIDVPRVLGSSSTCLAGGFGGFDGRVLRAGDTIAAGLHGSVKGTAPGPAPDAIRSGLVRSELVRPELVWPDAGPPPPRAGDAPAAVPVLRVLAGPEPGLDSVIAGQWHVGTAADRVGIRLDGDPLPPSIGGETLTHGVPWGAIQVPPGGGPIILGADHQATGGYRVVGVVISADLPILGQLGTGSAVRLAAIDRETAIGALRDRRDALRAGAEALREASSWGALIDAAGS